MSKRLRGYNWDGTTFGMDVDGKRAAAVLKKAEYRDVPSRYSSATRKRLCIPWNQVASLMGDAAWLVTERRAFEYVQFDDDDYKYTVLYPEKEVKV